MLLGFRGTLEGDNQLLLGHAREVDRLDLLALELRYRAVLLLRQHPASST